MTGTRRLDQPRSCHFGESPPPRIAQAAEAAGLIGPREVVRLEC
jgi:hypothetical protein